MKALTRFKQGGGFRLAIALTRMGLLPDLLKACFNILLKRNSYQRQYRILGNKITPKLTEEFNRILDEADKRIQKYEQKKDIKDEKGKYVWFCWMQGIEKAPEIVNICLESQKKWLKDRNFVIITAENYKDYISLPEFIEEKYSSHVIPDAMFTDLIRVELLIKYGGTWIDSTVMITGNNYPKEILDCPIFMPQYVNRDGNWEGISSWMITARRGNHLLLLLREMLFEYWRRYDCVIYYYILHLFFKMIASKYTDEIEKMPFINSYQCIELLKHLGEHDPEGKLQQHLSTASIHKLSYRLSKEIFNDKRNILHKLFELTK